MGRFVDKTLCLNAGGGVFSAVSEDKSYLTNYLSKSVQGEALAQSRSLPEAIIIPLTPLF
ncbi:MAG: hypothetical protein ACI9WS_002417 [Paraglaciecola psychrophila]|jgi:hypothetical protein